MSLSWPKAATSSSFFFLAAWRAAWTFGDHALARGEGSLVVALVEGGLGLRHLGERALSSPGTYFSISGLACSRAALAAPRACSAAPLPQAAARAARPRARTRVLAGFRDIGWVLLGPWGARAFGAEGGFYPGGAASATRRSSPVQRHSSDLTRRTLLSDSARLSSKRGRVLVSRPMPEIPPPLGGALTALLIGLLIGTRPRARAARPPGGLRGDPHLPPGRALRLPRRAGHAARPALPARGGAARRRRPRRRLLRDASGGGRHHRGGGAPHLPPGRAGGLGPGAAGRRPGRDLGRAPRPCAIRCTAWPSASAKTRSWPS